MNNLAATISFQGLYLSPPLTPMFCGLYPKSTGGIRRPSSHSPIRVILYLRSKSERKAPRADDSLWIRVWPETASCRTMVYLFHRAPLRIASALVALASRSVHRDPPRRAAAVLRYTVFRKSVRHRAMLNPESIRATRGLWPAARYCIPEASHPCKGNPCLPHRLRLNPS
jgi:hypothetical protein